MTGHRAHRCGVFAGAHILVVVWIIDPAIACFDPRMCDKHDIEVNEAMHQRETFRAGLFLYRAKC
jgi:hypothetical protein